MDASNSAPPDAPTPKIVISTEAAHSLIVSSAAEKSAVFRRCSIPIPSPKPAILSEVEGPAVAFAVAVAIAFLAVIPKGDLLSPLPLLLPFLFSSRRDLLSSLFSFGQPKQNGCPILRVFAKGGI
jgi:hypothetical protein